MKKPIRKELSLSITTVRSLVRSVDDRALEVVAGGVYKASVNGCYTRPQGGCA